MIWLSVARGRPQLKIKASGLGRVDFWHSGSCKTQPATLDRVGIGSMLTEVSWLRTDKGVICFQTSDFELVAREQGIKKAEEVHADEEVLYKVDVPANRWVDTNTLVRCAEWILAH